MDRHPSSEDLMRLCPEPPSPPVGQKRKATYVDLTADASLPTPKKKPSFCLQCSKILLTFPQCTLSPDQALERCKKFETLLWAIVAQEKHQDGSPHLHVVMMFKEKLRLQGKKGMSVLDEIGGKHGDYKAVGKRTCDLVNTVKYVVKDGNYVTHGIDVENFLSQSKPNAKANSGVWAAAASKLVAGTTIADLNAWNPSFVCNNLKKLQDYSQWLARRADQTKKELLVRVGQEIPTSSGLKLIAWMNLNLTLDQTGSRPMRQKQLWLYGPPGIGKTTLCLTLSNYLRIYTVPNDEDFYDDYEDECYDLVVFDEFKGQKKIQWMNSFLDGQPKPLRKKGSQYVKRKNLPCIILSNFSPAQCYHKAFNQHASQLAPLLDRLEIIEWDTNFIDIEYIGESACSDYEKEDCAKSNWADYINHITSDESADT